MRRGDERAWAEFLDRYERLIFAVPRRMGLDREESADVFQDVAIAFLRGLPRLRDVRTIPRWLSQTAFRIARDRRVRQRREMHPEDDAFWEVVPDPSPEVAEILDAFRARAAVHAALAQLSERCRRMLTLLFLTDPAPSYAEIARRLAQPVGSIGPTRRRCLARALEALAESGIKTAVDPTFPSKVRRKRIASRRSR